MKTSVSTRMSATVPFGSAGHRGIRGCAERGRECEFWIGALVLEVDVEGTSDDRRHGHAFRFGEGVDSLALFIGEIHLGSSR